jgi:hypothetical protein
VGFCRWWWYSSFGRNYWYFFITDDRWWWISDACKLSFKVLKYCKILKCCKATW